MNYVFFDIECAFCEKHGVAYICEFGYVIVNSNFDIIEKQHFLINPAHFFDRYALKKILHYPKKQYENSPLFPEFYDSIAEVLSGNDKTIIGHTVELDYKYLSSECKRYNKKKIKFDRYDIAQAFQILENEEQISSLGKMVEKLEISIAEPLHDALSDAIATMLVTKQLAEKYNKSIEELVAIKIPKKQKPNKKSNWAIRKAKLKAKKLALKQQEQQ